MLKSSIVVCLFMLFCDAHMHAASGKSGAVTKAAKKDISALTTAAKQDAAAVAGAVSQGAAAVQQDLLNDLPQAEGFFSSLYANHPYVCYVGIAALTGVLLYFANDHFEWGIGKKVTQLLHIDQTKNCACGCATQCNCRTGSETGCSMKPGKALEGCACCVVRPVSVK